MIALISRLFKWLSGTTAGRIVLAIGAAILALIGAFFLGRRAQQKKIEIDALEAQVETFGRMNDADVSRGDAADDLDWLQQRSKR
jgi:hypothetical protein